MGKNSASSSKASNKQYQQGAVCCINKQCADPTDSFSMSFDTHVACDTNDDKSQGTMPVHYDRASKELCIDEHGSYGKICNNGDCYSAGWYCNWDSSTGAKIDSGDYKDWEFDEKAVATILIIIIVVAILGIIGCIICCVCCCKQQKANQAVVAQGGAQMTSA